MASQTYPGGTGGEAGERVQTDYDVWGRPVVVSSTSLYVTSAAYDALGRPATMALGNGQQTQYAQCGDDCVGNVKAITIRQ